MDPYQPPSGDFVLERNEFGSHVPTGPPGYFDLADTMQRAFRLLFSRQGMVMLGVSTLAMGTMGAIMSAFMYAGIGIALDRGWTTGNTPDPGTIAAFVAVAVVVYVVSLLVYAWFFAGMTDYTARVGRGENPRVSILFMAGRRFGAFLGAMLLSVLICFGIYVGGGIAIILLAILHPFLAVVGAIVVFVALIYAGLGIALALPAVIAGGQSATGAIGDSWRVAKGKRLPLLLMAFIAFAIYMIVYLVAQLVVGGGAAFKVSSENVGDFHGILTQMYAMRGAMIAPTILTILGGMCAGVLWSGFSVFGYQAMRGLNKPR